MDGARGRRGRKQMELWMGAQAIRGSLDGGTSKRLSASSMLAF